QDILLATRSGMCIRFPVVDVRVFTGRTSTGVRGIRLAKDDEVISMSVLRHMEMDTAVRDEYLQISAALRRSDDSNGGADNGPRTITDEQLEELTASEEFILAVTEKGFGKRTSAFEYRTTGRGGKGIGNVDITSRNGPVAAAFPVNVADQIMLVTDAGQLIRCPVDDIRIAGRRTQGVTLFRVDKEERVVSVARLRDVADDENGDDEGDDDSDVTDDNNKKGKDDD
ncbi:MAG: DNA gyrase subunit A, partial [Alphaproteobacteria bacterium]|nr:DNA gyrase subunit A [Alphaproteobacteria bacterium]